MTMKNIDVQEFKELKDQPNHVVLDVRSPQELSEGAVPGHKLINFFAPDFADKVSQLDKSASYLVYCRSGNRSGQACALMSDMGFANVYNLMGGIGAWNASQN